MLHLLTNTLAFVFALGVIIFVHEAGHLLAAKAFGIRVHVFSLGFGRRMWGFRRGDTEYRVAWLPLGGYVRLGGEDPEEATGDPREFLSKPRWQRVIVYLAGPAMNVVLSIVLVAIVFMAGIEVPMVPDIPAVVGSVAADSAGAAADIRPGDRIVAIDGKAVAHWDEVRFAITTSPDRPIHLTIRRADERLAKTLTPEKVPSYEFGDAGIFPRVLPRVHEVLADTPAARAGLRAGDVVREVDGRAILSLEEFISYVEERAGRPILLGILRDGRPLSLKVTPASEEGKGRIGVLLTYAQRYPPLAAIGESLRYNWQIARQTVAVLGKIVSGRLAAKSALSGPIEIAALSGAAARNGVKDLIHLMGLLSVSIALLNLLPIPVLDGGQIFILLIEGTMRRDLSVAVKERINQAGLLLIVMLMVVALYFDLTKTLPAGLLPGS